jgi:hypothetical protein
VKVAKDLWTFRIESSYLERSLEVWAGVREERWRRKESMQEVGVPCDLTVGLAPSSLEGLEIELRA